MRKFDVALDRPRWECAHVEIEAASEEEAERIARELSAEALDALEWVSEEDTESPTVAYTDDITEEVTE